MTRMSQKAKVWKLAVCRVKGVSVSRQKRYDRAAKLVLRNAPVLALLVKANVPEAAQMSLAEIEDRLRHPVDVCKRRKGRRQARLEETEVGHIICDVLFTFKISEGVFVRINVEAQNSAHPGYSLITRAIEYGAELLSDQMEKWASGSRYDNVVKVYSIWLVSNAPKYLQGQVLRLGIFGNRYLPDGQAELFQTIPEADKLCVVMAYLPEKEQADKVSQSWMRVFSVLFNEASTKEECEGVLNEFGIAVDEVFEKEIVDMCSLGQGIVDRVTARVTKAVTDSVTKSVTDSVTKSVTDSVTKAVTEKKDKEFAAELEQAAVGLMSEGLSVGTVAKYLKLPLSVIQALAAKQAGRSTSGGCFA